MLIRYSLKSLITLGKLKMVEKVTKVTKKRAPRKAAKKILEYVNERQVGFSYATSGSAGIDLTSVLKYHVGAGKTVLCETGTYVSIPEGYCGVIMSRSGLGVGGLAVAQGVGLIDSDYRGELLVPIFNRTYQGKTIMGGDRIAQLVIMPVIQPELIEVKKLKATERGEGGFGSTGK